MAHRWNYLSQFSSVPVTPPTRPLVVFDLDQTLVDALSPIETHGVSKTLDRIHIDGYTVYLRPGIRRCLPKIAQRYDIGIWSAGSTAYVDEIVEKCIQPLIPDTQPCFVFSRPLCDQCERFSHIIKDIRLVGEPDTMVMIEDNTEISEAFPEQTILVPPFEVRTNASDRGLHRLSKKVRHHFRDALPLRLKENDTGEIENDTGENPDIEIEIEIESNGDDKTDNTDKTDKTDETKKTARKRKKQK